MRAGQTGMKAKEIRALSAEEQAHRLAEAEKELLNLRIQQAAGQLDKPDRVRRIRRELARIRTIMNEAQGAR